MKNLQSFCGSILIIGLLLGFGAELFADEPKIEIIDKTNWEKVEGLVPDVYLEWVKTGEFTLKVGEVNYDPLEFYPGYSKEADTANLGKYELDEDNIIIDVKTGEVAKDIVGFPFPKVDPNDPKAAMKIMYNKQYVTYIIGNKNITGYFEWIGRGGHEREIQALLLDAYLVGYPAALKSKNPKDAERYNLLSVRSPYDLAGTTVLTWRYLDNRQDVSFMYIPAIRRVRRTTPANRSDGFVGSDFALDDILAYDGKIPAFEWKLLGQQEALVPFHMVEPIRTSITKDGEWNASKDTPEALFGFEKEGWQGAPWCPLSFVYAKRPVWVIQGTSKDPYYNYGVQYMWVDRETWGPYYKMTNDRSDKFWKILICSTSGFQTPEKDLQFLAWTDQLTVDPRRDHATWIKIVSPRSRIFFNAVLDLQDFTLGGFQKYCK